MSLLNTISGASGLIGVGSSALSTIGLGAALITPQKGKRGIEGFLMDIPISETVNYNAQITDHYVEDNTFIQDHVAIEPIKITLVGKVAELVVSKPAALAFASAVSERLAPLGVFSPGQRQKATDAIATAAVALSAIDSATAALNDLGGLFSDDLGKNKQQNAFKKFEGWFNTRAIISVETPWRTYTDMIIESWSAEQGEESIYESTFTLNFKQMRFVSTSINTGKLFGRVKEQSAVEVPKGVPGQTATTSVELGKFTGWLK